MVFLTTFRRVLSLPAETRCMYRSFTSRPLLSSNLVNSNVDDLLKIIAESRPSDLPLKAAKPARAPNLTEQRHKNTHDIAKRWISEQQPVALGPELVEQSMREDRLRRVERLQTRPWKQGDVYAPHDLTPAEMTKWRRRQRPTTDPFDVLGINPLDEYKNYAMMSEFMTTMGRIKHPRDTGLRPVNQRRIAKAIRRAIGMGWMPSVHAHPEMLRRRGY